MLIQSEAPAHTHARYWLQPAGPAAESDYSIHVYNIELSETADSALLVRLFIIITLYAVVCSVSSTPASDGCIVSCSDQDSLCSH